MRSLEVVAVHPPVVGCRDGSAWAVFEVDPFAYAFASDAERADQLAQAAAVLWAAGTELQLLGLADVVDQSAAFKLLGTTDGGDEDRDRRRRWAERIAAERLHARRLFLTARLPDVDGSPWSAVRKGWSDVRVAIERAAGTHAPSSAIDRKLRLGQAAHVEALLSTRIPIRRADLATISLLLRRPYGRGLEPMGETRTLDPWGSIGPSGVAALTEALVEEDLRSLRVETETGERYHSYLAVAQLPARLPFPGAEWLFLAEEATFPVDWSVRVVTVPAREARARAERKALDLADQDFQQSGGDVPAPLALTEARSDAEDLRYRLQTTGAPLLFCSALFCVWADERAELDRRVDELRALYAPHAIQLARPTGDQFRAMRETALGSRTLLRDYVQVLPPETLAGAMPFAARGAGDPRGLLLGFTSGGLRRAVMLDPHLAPLRERSPSMAIVGTLGAGKSFAAKLILHEAILREATALVVDPKDEYGSLTELLGPDARLIRLSPDARASLDPFSSMRDPVAARAAALSFLTLLLGIPPVTATGGVLARALAEVASSPSPGLSSLPRVLDGLGDEARELRDRLEVFLAHPLAGLAFGEGREPALAKLTVVQTSGLELPDQATLDRDLREGRLSPERQLSLALLYLVAALGSSLAERDPGTLKLLVVDEAWTVVRTPEGQSLVERLVRTGRSRNAGVILISQEATDLPEPVRGNLGTRLAFRAGGTEQARASLALVGTEESRDNLDLIRSLPTGRCLMRDLDGRVELVDVAQGFPEQQSAFESSPGARP
jgi:hypothetical protein